MKVVVTGGRNYDDKEFFFAVMDRLHKEYNFTAVAHGACGWNGDDPETWQTRNLKGADGLAEDWACDRMVGEIARYPAQWDTYGHGGGPRRNGAMLDAEKPDIVVAFPGDRGTNNCIAQAKERGIKVHRIWIEELKK